MVNTIILQMKVIQMMIISPQLKVKIQKGAKNLNVYECIASTPTTK